MTGDAQADLRLAPEGATSASEILATRQLLSDTLDRLVGLLNRDGGWLATCEPDDTRGAAGPGSALVDSVFCLGAFQVRIGGRPLTSWRSGKALALFQYLVAYRGHPRSRDALIEAVWPNPEALAAGVSLKVAVHSLRQMLAGTGLVIEAQGASYRLTGAELWVDAEQFERCCALARRLEAAGRSAEALVQYARAAELYRGDFLEEAWDEWVLLRREGLKDQYLAALGKLAEAAQAQGDDQDCIVRCQQLLAQDPCREDAYRLLMACHGRLGQRGRVRSWYELCRRQLRTHLDLEPERATEQAYRAALAERGTGAPAQPLNLTTSNVFNSAVTAS